MKKERRLWLLLILTTLFITKVSFGQSGEDALLDKCAANLGTYNYIRSFNVSVTLWKKANPEYSYVFSKGSTYLLIGCEGNTTGGKMIINLFDRNHKLIASTYDGKTKIHYSDLLYPCSATGVYYLEAYFEGMKRGRGICILGFSKDK